MKMEIEYEKMICENGQGLSVNEEVIVLRAKNGEMIKIIRNSCPDEEEWEAWEEAIE